MEQAYLATAIWKCDQCLSDSLQDVRLSSLIGELPKDVGF